MNFSINFFILKKLEIILSIKLEMLVIIFEILKILLSLYILLEQTESEVYQKWYFRFLKKHEKKFECIPVLIL